MASGQVSGCVLDSTQGAVQKNSSGFAAWSDGVSRMHWEFSQSPTMVWVGKHLVDGSFTSNPPAMGRDPPA